MIAIKIKPPARFSVVEALEHIWDALQCYKDHFIYGDEYKEEWDNICKAMAWIEDELKAKPVSFEAKFIKEMDEAMERFHNKLKNKGE